MMRRREGESILIGEEIEIHIAHIGRSRVKIAIRAPREVKVVAKEIEMVGRENRAAAASAPAPDLAGRIARALGKKLSQAARAGADKASEG
jgi:carbon storage regulator